MDARINDRQAVVRSRHGPATAGGVTTGEASTGEVPGHASPRPSPRVRTVDVFDTLLLRHATCGARRERQVAEAYRRDAAGHVHADASARARARASAALYRALPPGRDGHGVGDVRFAALARLTLESLGERVDEPAIERFRDAELRVEAASLRANAPLLRELREARARGTRVVAISDTPHRAGDVRRLIESVAGTPPPIDALHTSADHDATKREGSLFAHVLAVEGIDASQCDHLGDDALADGRRADEAGLAVTVAPRARAHHWRRQADAARWRMVATRSVPDRTARTGDKIERAAADAIVEAMHRLWTQLRAHEIVASDRDPAAPLPVALFCARGGLTMRALLERFVKRTGLPLDLPRDDLMVSRLVACRAALVGGSEAAFDECAREFRGQPMRAALGALAGEAIAAPGIAADAPFDVAALRRFLAGPAGDELRALLRRQAERFEAHLRALVGPASTVVLVDTGLFGSTLRLLADAYPDLDWRCVLLARANYKGLDASHFARTVGLWCERDRYAPHDARSVVLRYWQWIEHLFEPPLPSVRGFDGDGRSTLEREAPDWREALLRSPDPVMAEAWRTIDALGPGDLPHLAARGRRGWRVLHRALAFPSPRLAAQLAVRRRSRDFGLDGHVDAWSTRRSVAALREARWKEGALAHLYPALRLPAQLVLEALHAARWTGAALRR